MSLTGSAEGPPLRPGPTFADSSSGLLTAIGILMALFGKSRNGVVRHVDVALQDSIVNACRVAFGIQALTGKPGTRLGNQIQFPSSPAEAYACAPGGVDDYCYIYVGRGETGDRNWVRLLEVIGRRDLIGDERFTTNAARLANQKLVDEIVLNWTKGKTKFEVMKEAGGYGVPVAPVLNTQDLVEDPGLRERGAIVEVDHPRRGRYAVPGAPFQLSGTNVEVTPAPALGEANDYVLKVLLGTSADEFARLRAEGVI